MTISIGEIRTDDDGIRRGYIREQDGLTQLTQEQIDIFKSIGERAEIPGTDIKLVFTVYGNILKMGSLQLAPAFEIFIFDRELKKWESMNSSPFNANFEEALTELIDEVY